MQLIIWTQMARSLVFYNVTNFTFHSQGFEFDYISMTTDEAKHANFNNTSVAGYATTKKTQSSSK